MSTVADIFARVRAELTGDYSDTSRWDDTNLLYLLRLVVERCNAVAVANDLPIARKRHTFSTVASTASYSLPTDFGSAVYLLRTDTHKELHFNTENEWDRLVSSQSEASEWTIIPDTSDSDTQKIFISGTPSAAIAMVMPYYPIIDTSAYTTSTTMPWGGKLDSLICDYLRMRAQNSDEMDVSQDQQFMAELESRVIDLLSGQQPRVFSRRGWNTGSTS